MTGARRLGPAVVLAALIVPIVLPFWWALAASLSPERLLFEGLPWFPADPTLEHYRALFREIIPTGVQRALARGCGDRFTPGSPARVLDYPCKPDLEAAAVDAAAAALRSDPQALRLLRRRLADVETQLSDLGRNNGNLLRGLADIGKEAP